MWYFNAWVTFFRLHATSPCAPAICWRTQVRWLAKTWSKATPCVPASHIYTMLSVSRPQERKTDENTLLPWPRGKINKVVDRTRSTLRFRRKVHTPDRYRVKPYVLAVLWCYLNPIISSSARIPLSLPLSLTWILWPRLKQTKKMKNPRDSSIVAFRTKDKKPKTQNHRRSCGGRPSSIPHTWLPETVPAVEPRVGVVCKKKKKPGGPPGSVRYLRVRRLHTIWSRSRCCWLYRRLSHWTMAPSVRFQKIPACQFISCCVHGARTLLHTLNCRQKTLFPSPFPASWNLAPGSTILDAAEGWNHNLTRECYILWSEIDEKHVL